MRSLKFMKIDFMKNRKQGRLMIFILAIGLFLSRGENNGYLAGLFYTVYIGCVFINVIFADFSMHNAGFLLLLPGSVWHRVCGRFFYGISSEVALGAAYWLLATAIGGNLTLMVQSLPIYLLIILLGIVMIDLQFLLFYLVGEMKNQYVMNLVRILFPMCFWAISYGILNIIGDGNEEGALLMSALYWVSGHMALCGIMMLGFVSVLTFISIWISAKVCSKRDYA